MADKNKNRVVNTSGAINAKSGVNAVSTVVRSIPESLEAEAAVLGSMLLDPLLQDRYLRHLIVESAWVAIRKDPALLLCYHEYCRRMEKQEAIIRIAKKLLNRMRHVWKNEASYVYSVVA